KVAPFSPSETTYAAMGRFGNLMLVGGQTHYRAAARTGEVLRLWLTNTANTRVFNVRLAGARMKLVGGDSGRVERSEFVEEVLLAPSERAVVDVLLDRPGELTLEHRTPDRSYPLATVSVAGEPAATAAAREFEVLREAPELAAERRSLDAWLAAAPDKTLALVAEMDDPGAASGGPVIYACPMHPAVTSDQPGRCPECGMKLLATRTSAESAAEHGPGMHDGAHGGSDHHDHGADMDHHAGPDAPHSHGSGSAGWIEWEDDMVAVNRQTTAATMHWMFVDRTPGAADTGIDWQFTLGDRVKI